jgi:hypothetical protein
VSLAGALLVSPLSTPIAWTVAVPDKVKGPVYLELALVGAVPLVV